MIHGADGHGGSTSTWSGAANLAYPSQASLHACLEEGRMQDALAIAEARVQLRPDDPEAWAVRDSLLPPETAAVPAATAAPPPAPATAVDVLDAASWGQPELVAWLQRLMEVQSNMFDLLRRARALVVVELDNPAVISAAPAAAAWLQRMCLVDLPGVPQPAPGQTGLGLAPEQAATCWLRALPHAVPEPLAAAAPPPHLETELDTDETGRPRWLLAAQQALLRETWPLHDAMVRLQVQAAEQPVRTRRLEQATAQLDLRHALVRAVDDLRARWGDVPGSQRSAVELWQQAADEAFIFAQLSERDEEVGRVSAALIERAGQSPLVARLWARAARARYESQPALAMLHRCARRHPNDRALQLSLFAQLMSNQNDKDSALARKIFRDDAAAATAATELWGGHGPLPAYLGEMLHRLFLTDTNKLVDYVGTVKVGQELKRKLLLTLLEEHLGSAQAGTFQDRQTRTSFNCKTCYEECAPWQDATAVNCTCLSGAKVCTGCAVKTIRTADALAIKGKCSFGCGAMLTRQDLERLGLNQVEVMAHLPWIVDGLLRERLPNWIVCSGPIRRPKSIGGDAAGLLPRRVSNWIARSGPSKGPSKDPKCIGGYVVDNIKQYRYSCSLCGAVNQSNVEQDPQIVRRLLQGVLGQGLYRECRNCGVSVEKNGGCSHMHCWKCKDDWSFDGHYPKPRQPGVLSKIGFYDHLDDKSVGAVHERANAWLKRYPEAAEG